MYCNQCGKQIPDDAKFCHQCGSAIGTEQNHEVRSGQPKKKINFPARKKEKKKSPAAAFEKTKSPAAPFKRKKLLAIAGIAVIVLVIIVGAVIGLRPQEVIAAVPDPEYFYGNHDAVDDIEEVDDIKRVILRSDEDLWTEVAAYVNLLKYSGKYEFESNNEDLYDSGDYAWQFVYSGSEEIKDYYFCQIEINYYAKSNGRDCYAVWITIHDIDNFELVQEDVYDPDNIYGTEPFSEEETEAISNDVTETTPAYDDADSGWDDADSDSDWEDDLWEDTNNDLYDAEPICGVCDGDGDCDTCGGDGLLHSSASDEEDRNCYSCSGSGNCRSCGGDGKL